jgi:hypothetical protein
MTPSRTAWPPTGDLAGPLERGALKPLKANKGVAKAKKAAFGREAA